MKFLILLIVFFSRELSAQYMSHNISEFGTEDIQSISIENDIITIKGNKAETFHFYQTQNGADVFNFSVTNLVIHKKKSHFQPEQCAYYINDLLIASRINRINSYKFSLTAVMDVEVKKSRSEITAIIRDYSYQNENEGMLNSLGEKCRSYPYKIYK